MWVTPPPLLKSIYIIYNYIKKSNYFGVDNAVFLCELMWGNLFLMWTNLKSREFNLK